MNPSWSIRTPLFTDELFSSWLIRSALNLGCDPMVLTSLIWPKWRIWTIDRDRRISSTKLKLLTEKASVKPSYFSNCFIYPIINSITTKPLRNNAIWPWLLTYGIRNRKTHGGLQYCPLCLQKDNEAFYRLSWRLAWHTTCEVHQVQLLDRCQACHSPIRPHLLECSDKTLRLCATCKTDLSQTSPPKANPDSLKLQLICEQSRRLSVGKIAHQSVKLTSFFELIQFYIRLLRYTAKTQIKKFVRLVSQLGFGENKLKRIHSDLSFELLNVEDRSKLLAATNSLLKTNITNLKALMGELDITHRQMITATGCVPAILADGQHNFKSRHLKNTTNSNQDSCLQPAPLHTVIAKHNRLLRKHRAG